MTFFLIISNLHVQESKFGKNIYKFGGKSKKNLNSAEFMEFVFSMSGERLFLKLVQRNFSFRVH